MAVSAQGTSRPASETADRFVGTWILNVAKSTFEGAPAPKSGMRTFDYERDGTILCTVHAVNAAGRPSFVHFLITLDGREYEELSRSSSPNRSPTFVTAKKIDDHRIDLTFKRDGKVFIWHAWSISEDGKTFTVRRKGTTTQGQPTNFVMVYEKQQ
jgi:hypothetical protein